MLVGPPASGKSYLARLLVDRTGAELLQTDALRKSMFKRPTYKGSESAAVYAAAHRRISRALGCGRSMIFDATNLAERGRQRVYRLADEIGANVLVVLLYAPLDVIRQRLSARAAGSDPLDRSDADWQVYNKLGPAEPIHRPHLVVNSTVDLRQAVDLITARR